MPQLSFMLPGEMFGLPVGANGIMAPTSVLATDPVALNYQLAAEEWAHVQANNLEDKSERGYAKHAFEARGPRKIWNERCALNPGKEKKRQ